MPLNTLIVEDDTAFLKLLELRLKAWQPDIKIQHTPSIADARKFLDQNSTAVDLVILDQHLPDGMGSELLTHPGIGSATVLALSSDEAPDLPAAALRAGAGHFLKKTQVREPLFLPLIDALIERKRFESEAITSKLRESRLESIRTLLATLRHEINNPLGAVLGATYLLRSAGNLDHEQSNALSLIESSGERIHHVLRELCAAAELRGLEEVTKAHERVFQVPGDPAWGEKKK